MHVANDLTLMCLQLNELNFPFIADYAQRGLLPNFKKFFDKAGLSMENKANIVSVYGHVGPHPKEYHKEVFETLDRATRGCVPGADCRERLLLALASLAKEIAKPGTVLNDLITRDCE